VFSDCDGNEGYPHDVASAGLLSPYGTMGQGGSVWEWNDTLLGGSYRGLYGELFDIPYEGSGVHYLRADDRIGGTVPAAEYYGIGFRVASIGVVHGVSEQGRNHPLQGGRRNPELCGQLAPRATLCGSSVTISTMAQKHQNTNRNTILGSQLHCS
jgi:hypothetical protein